MLLIGQNSTAYREQLIARQPQLEGRVVATGDVALEDAAASIAACDLMLQPFPDGASSRRSSLMAPLALGRPIMTNLGYWSEPVWAKSGSVDITDFSDSEAALRRIESLIARPERRIALGERARQVYDERFSWQRTLRTLTRGAMREKSAQTSASGVTKPTDYALAGD
jgi:glycosyltransferase involved in cell wall biosynthesis